MDAYKKEKYRHELKYICSEMCLTIIEQKIKRIMQIDPHANEQGEYIIRSVYFDDYKHTCFYENENGIDPREKFRIRIYNYSTKRIALERKKKKNGMTGKDVCIITPEICFHMLHEDKGDCMKYSGFHPLLDEWIINNQRNLLKPVLLGEYVRKPYVYRLGNVRVTFDRYISVSRQILDFSHKEISRISVLPTGYHILEVKWDEYLPDVIYQLIEDGHIQQSTFSKYYLGCKALEGRLNEF